MINALMFGALGFFVACLLALMLAAPLWNRAVRLTTRRLEATMPMSLNDIQADKDQLRAEFAIELRKVEVALEKAKEKATRELIEANKRRVEIAMLNTDLSAAKAQLQENDNANRVLQQTIKRRLPDLDSRLKAAKKALAELESVNAELRTTVASQSEALKTARTTLHNQRTDIDRLRAALESGSAGGLRGIGKPDARTLAESQRLSAELSKVQEELERARASAEENLLLRRELSRLASQILNVARTQNVAQHQRGLNVAQVYTQPTAIEEAQPQIEPVQAWEPAHAGNGAAHEEQEDVEAVAEVDTVAAGMTRAAFADEADGPAEAEAEDDVDTESEAGEHQTSFAQRFVARREARRSRKSGGMSLGARLRGLVVERPET
jgi:predicted  nucleic acid-binding Zn-ribbon protein